MLKKSILWVTPLAFLQNLLYNILPSKEDLMWPKTTEISNKF